jgi:fluoroquinolone transport system permease protein
VNFRRFAAALANDVRFQYRYGFYLLYLVVSVVYAGMLLAMPQGWRPLAAALVLFSDPAALGLFFMGGIILFEKSERTLDFLFVSPFTPGEYLCAKILSLAVISTLAGLAIVSISIPGRFSPVILAAGLFTGSALFSLLGMAVAGRVRSLNRFFIAIAPLTLVLWVPPFMVLGNTMNLWELPGSMVLWDLHPGIALLSVMLQGAGADGGASITRHLLTVAIWTAAAIPLVLKRVRQMVKELGGMQL